MTATAAMILSNKGEKFPKLPLDRATTDALAEFVRLQWPTHTRKNVEREYSLTTQEAKTVVEGNPSKATLDRIWKHKNGGWRVLLPVMGAVVGQTADAFIIEERKRLARERDEYQAQSARMAALGRDFLAVFSVGSRGSDVGGSTADRERSEPTGRVVRRANGGSSRA